MKILILGNARHGKDTLAELLAEYFGMTYKSSSEMAMEIFLFDKIAEKHGYKTMKECFDDRVNHRQLWYLSICDYNKDDRARLAKDILEAHDCYVGMRDLEEFEASKDLFDAIIWVDASKRLGTSEYTNKIPVEEADIVITNNGTFEDFKEKSRLLGKMLFDKEADKTLFKNSKMHW
jgi:dephospho-CoA kinase